MISASVVGREPVEPDHFIKVRDIENGNAYLSAILALMFWDKTGAEIPKNLVVKNDGSPIISNSGEFLT